MALNELHVLPLKPVAAWKEPMSTKGTRIPGG